MRINIERTIDVGGWDDLVEETYGRPYSFQQQEGCRERGVFRFSVPDDPSDYERDSIPENLDHEEMGVSLAAWLARDPDKPLKDDNFELSLGLWWHRNFYPDVQMVANDLHSRGLLPAGPYTLIIDW